MKKYALPLAMLAVFEAIAVTLWLTKDNIFYLFNFSYIGISIALGLFLLLRKHKYARRIVQLLVGTYMLVYLGLICGENMQIEGFWYYLFTGVFEAATIHYAVAKIFGPLLFGRGWCGYACWTAMVLDFLPYKGPASPRKSSAGCAISPLPPHSFLWLPCFLPASGILSASCSGHSSSATSFITPPASRLRLPSRITAPSANISARSRSF